MDERLRFKLDDSYLQATIVNADGSEAVNEAVYQIFERLNSGGTQLTPHEIRVALYAGELIDYLEDLNQTPNWRALYGNPSPRIRDQELILRVLALYIDSASYARPLKTFLNSFVAAHRSADETIIHAGDLFVAACEKLSEMGPSAFRRPGGTQVNVAQTEALLVGIMRALDAGDLVSNLAAAIPALIADDSFTQATTRATSDRDAVVERLRLAGSAVSNGQ